ncbi:hypothetical protein DERF_011908 [Dermatophagoides farinae]|uniref:C2H2-type domain-containing protein n=1 Tax=Dermatophagoides farinae TaxID=6954 RepID=A0A922HQX7_DERFA|nr:hypothetical protein DERF_011908 [Dermatophagoides farinae]
MMNLFELKDKNLLRIDQNNNNIQNDYHRYHHQHQHHNYNHNHNRVSNIHSVYIQQQQQQQHQQQQNYYHHHHHHHQNRLSFPSSLSSTPSTTEINTHPLSTIAAAICSMDNQERKSIQNQFENNNIQDPNLCLLNLIQQQADIRFQSLLKRYENYLATAIESCLNSVRSVDQIIAAAAAAAAAASAAAASSSAATTNNSDRVTTSSSSTANDAVPPTKLSSTTIPITGPSSGHNHNHHHNSNNQLSSLTIALSKSNESNSNDNVIDHHQQNHHSLLMMNQAIKESIDVVATYNWSKLLQQPTTLLPLPPPPPPPSSLSPTESLSSSSSSSMIIGSSSTTSKSSSLVSTKMSLSNNDIKNKTKKTDLNNINDADDDVDVDVDVVVVEEEIDDDDDDGEDIDDQDCIEYDNIIDIDDADHHIDHHLNHFNRDQTNQNEIIDLKDRKTTTINRIDVEKFQCDWPGCIRRFQTEEILNHHRRFHIRKSNYQCKHCSLRLLDRRELLEHVVNCKPTATATATTTTTTTTTTTATTTTTKDCNKNLNPNHFISSPIDGVNMSIKSFNSSSTGLSSFPSSSSSLTLSIDMNDRKMLIDQLISPRMSKNRDLKKALLAVKTDVHLTSMNKNQMEIKSESLSSSSSLLSSPSSSSSSSSSSSTTTTLTNDQQQQYKRTRYSGIGRYRCPWPDCSYTPHFLRDLRRHMFKHTGDKRYKCPQCRFVSVWKTSLLQHQRKKHSITINNVSINTNNNN